MVAQSDQTQDPAAKGQGQQGGASSNQPLQADLEAKLAQATADLTTEKAARERAERLSREQQSRLDQFRARGLPTPGQQPTQPPAGVQGLTSPQSAAQQRLNELQQFATEKAKEAMLLRELAARGLTIAEVEGLEFETPTELKLLLDTITMRKEVAELRASSTERESKAKTSVPEVDTGGPSGLGASGSSTDLVEEYKTARNMGRTAQARWRLLNTIHQDPTKVVKP